MKKQLLWFLNVMVLAENVRCCNLTTFNVINYHENIGSLYFNHDITKPCLHIPVHWSNHILIYNNNKLVNDICQVLRQSFTRVEKKRRSFTNAYNCYLYHRMQAQNNYCMHTWCRRYITYNTSLLDNDLSWLIKFHLCSKCYNYNVYKCYNFTCVQSTCRVVY